MGVCTVGRVGLGVLRGLSTGIPQRLQILVSAKILTNVGNLLVDTERGDKPTSKALSEERILCEAPTEVSHEESSQDAVRDDVLRALRVSLPNDLSRLIFLAILRDNNSGHYYHPEVAQRFSVEVADRAMLACHHQIYERVVALPLEDLTDQLDAYMATVRAPKERLNRELDKTASLSRDDPDGCRPHLDRDFLHESWGRGCDLRSEASR